MANAATLSGQGTKLRIDPYCGIQTLQVGEKSYKVDTKGAVVRKMLSCGLPVTMAVPAKAFKGVAARAVQNDRGEMTVTLELLHQDPELCVPLLYANDMADIAADWHSWSRLMKLPMLIVGIEGKATAVQKTLGDILVEQPWERRKRITAIKHRPNFLRRRKPGVVGVVEKISAAELIARR
ncbi:MAG: DUF6101 family protein [Rhizobiaceae bacterium]|nr:DUF6101 family protein [Rhizobiaceae bacterium]